MRKFDYKTISFQLPAGVAQMEAELQKLGKSGWELVSVCPTCSSHYGLEEVTAFLKKEIVK